MSSVLAILKNTLSRLGLEAKFVLLASLVLIVGSSIANRLVFSYEHNERLYMVEEKGRLLAESMGISFTHTLLYEEIGLVEQTGLLDSFIRGIMKTRELDVQKVMVFNAHGRIIAHNDFSAYDRVYDDMYTKRALASRETLIQKYAIENANMLDIATPLQIGSKRWGTLRLLIALGRVEVSLNVFAQRLILLTMTSVLVGIVLALIVARRLARPIKSLTAAMEGVDAGLQTDFQVDRFDEIGQLQGSFIGMLSRLRTSAQEQAQMQRMVIHTERLASIGTLASGVAHEINNPLAGLRSCLRRIKREPENASQTQKYVGLMLNAVDRMGEIVKGMLDFARREETEKIPLQVVEVLMETVGLIEYQFRKRHIQLKTDYTNGLPVVQGDRGRIGQVFLNLMMNALDAMPEGGTLSIICGLKDGCVEIRFRDTGRGISKGQISRIFDPFYTTKDVGDGTGLGLSIVHGIVEDHNGRIAVDSVEGHGTEFVVFLPLDNYAHVTQDV